jgi:hypothetical protein
MAAGKAGWLWLAEARNCGAPAGHDDEAATIGLTEAGGDEALACPARDGAARAMRSRRARKQLETFIAWNLLLASGVAPGTGIVAQSDMRPPSYGGSVRLGNAFLARTSFEARTFMNSRTA